MDELPEVTVPPLPPNLVPRPEALEALCEKVLANQGQTSQTIALTAVEGMGGIGKTVLAQMLCHDPRIRKAFPDGIFWQTIGKESEIKPESRLRAIVEALRNDADKATKPGMAAADQYRMLMRDKAALLVIDDVWDANDLRPWLAESTRSRVLFTTRDTSIAGVVGADEHWAQQLSEVEARNVLKKWAGLTGELPPEGEELIKECGRLALGIAIVGAMLRNKPLSLWKRTLDLLCSAELGKISAQFPGQHGSLFRALHVSVEQLNDLQRDCYGALAVLLEEMPAPPVIQQTLWGMDGAEAAEICERLIGLSLAQREVDGESIKLHDLQLDYVRAQYPDPQALKVIHDAVRLSSHVVAKDPTQFASQVVGRLLGMEGNRGVKDFSAKLTEYAPCPWLRPFWPALDAPGGALLRTLEGHAGAVTSVAVSANGRRAASISKDKTLKVWDVDSGRLLRTLEGFESWAQNVAMSPDGRHMVAESGGTLKVWEVESGHLLRTVRVSDHESLYLASADGRWAVWASYDKAIAMPLRLRHIRAVKVWEVESGRPLSTLEGSWYQARYLEVSADGRYAVGSLGGGTLKVWEVKSGRLLRTLESSEDAVYRATTSANGGRAAAVSTRGTVKVWEVESGRLLRTLEGHAGWVNGVAVSADGRLVVASSGDGTARVWEIESGRLLSTLDGHSGWVLGVAISADGRRTISASEDRTIKVWEVGSRYPLRTLEGHSGSVLGMAVSADGRLAVSASWDQTVKVWEAPSGRLLRTLKGHAKGVYGVAVSGDGRLAVSASADQTVRVWEVESGRPVRTLEGHGDIVYAVAASADGRRVLSASADQTLKVWEVGSGRLLRTLQGHGGGVYAVAVSTDGRVAVSASDDQTVKVWEVESGHLLRTLDGYSGWIRSVALSGDGRWAVSAHWDKTLKVWEVESGRLLHTFNGHSGWIRGVAVSPDARRAVSASDDKTVRVWDLNRSTAVATFTCEGAAHCCAFAGSDRIVAGDGGGRLYFLQLKLARTMVKLPRVGFRKMEIAVSHDHATKKEHVFLSYCRDNREEVDRLWKELLGAGESVWWDQEIKGGEDWRSAIRKAMKNAYAFALCLSKESEARTTSGIYPEALDAINAYREYAPGTIFLIPVRLSECEIPDIEIDATRTLDRLQYVDLFPEAKRAEGIRKLLEAIRATPHHPSKTRSK